MGVFAAIFCNCLIGFYINQYILLLLLAKLLWRAVQVAQGLVCIFNNPIIP